NVRLRRDRQDLLGRQVQLVDILQTVRVGLAESGRPATPYVARVGEECVRNRVPLPSEEASRDTEVPGQLIEAADVERPLGVDPGRPVVVVRDVSVGAAVAAALGSFPDARVAAD